MAASKPVAAVLRKTARWCRAAAGDARGGAISEKFLALAAQLDTKAAQLERGGGNGTA